VKTKPAETMPRQKDRQKGKKKKKRGKKAFASSLARREWVWGTRLPGDGVLRGILTAILAMQGCQSKKGKKKGKKKILKQAHAFFTPSVAPLETEIFPNLKSDGSASSILLLKKYFFRAKKQQKKSSSQESEKEEGVSGLFRGFCIYWD
jgi:hypothetical protein